LKEAEMDKVFNVIISGVGGQGILTASELLSKVAMASGLDTKKSEVHGMSQRGGSVVSHVRFGRKVYSPLVEMGTCDLILSFEKSEALRWIHYLKVEGAKVIINDLELIPTTVSIGLDTYPRDIVKSIEEKVRAEVLLIPATDIANRTGDARTANTVLLGAMSNYLPFEPIVWEKVITESFKKHTIEANLMAFRFGREFK